MGSIVDVFRITLLSLEEHIDDKVLDEDEHVFIMSDWVSVVTSVKSSTSPKGKAGSVTSKIDPVESDLTWLVDETDCNSSAMFSKGSDGS